MKYCTTKADVAAYVASQLQLLPESYTLTIAIERGKSEGFYVSIVTIESSGASVTRKYLIGRQPISDAARASSPPRKSGDADALV